MPAAELARSSGHLELLTRRVNDGATVTLRLPQVVAAESDPLLSVAGCVYAEAIISLPGAAPITARTACIQRG